MKTEDMLILECCKFRVPDKDLLTFLIQECDDHTYVSKQLIKHRVASLAYFIIHNTELEDLFDKDAFKMLENEYKLCCIKSDNIIQIRSNLSKILKDVDFPYAVLKGGYLMDMYPHGLRISNDIDILVAQENLNKVEKILKNSGFTQGYIKNGNLVLATHVEIVTTRMSRGETVPFIKKTYLSKVPYAEIDINFSMDYKPGGNSNIVQHMLRCVNPFEIGDGDSLFTLCDEDFLIHLCVHLYKEATVYSWVERGIDLRLYKFVDIFLMLETKFNNNEKKQRLLNNIKKYGLCHECYYALTYTYMLFKSKTAKDIASKIRPQNTDYLNLVFRPEIKKIYKYEVPFYNRLFAENRRSMLYEVTDV